MKALSLAGVWEDTYPNRPNNNAVTISARARQKLTTMTPFQTPHLVTAKGIQSFEALQRMERLENND